MRKRIWGVLGVCLALPACTGTHYEPGAYRNGVLVQPRNLGLNEDNAFRFVDKWRIRHKWIGGPVDVRPCMYDGNPFDLVPGFDKLKRENASPIVERDGRLYSVGIDLKGQLYLSRKNNYFYGTSNNPGRENEFEGYTSICQHYFRDTLDGIGLDIVLPDPAKGTDEWIQGAKSVTINGLQWFHKSAPIRDWTGSHERGSGLVESWVLMIPKTTFWIRWTLYSGTGETSPYKIKNGAFHHPEKHRQIVDYFHQLVESVRLEPIEPVDLSTLVVHTSKKRD